MTIVVAVVTPESIVMASDSATTQSQSVVGSSGPPRAVNFWNSANKIVNLPKNLPVGVMTFGAAIIDDRTIATHVKDLRAILTGAVAHPSVAALTDNYSVEDIANAVASYFGPSHRASGSGILGFLVGGFSGGQVSPEVWQVVIDAAEPDADVSCQARPGEHIILHQGMTDAVSRVVDGVGQAIPQALIALGAPQPEAENIAGQLKSMMTVPLVWPGMPLGETIDLATFLVDTTIKFVRFIPGDASVGGPIEVAAITRHEGFKWVKRKHYYSPELNPKEVEP